MGVAILLLQAAMGIWLIISPAVFGYVGTAAATNDRIVGPFIATFAVIAMGDATRNVRWWNLPLAAWMLIGLAIFDYPVWAMVCLAAAMLVTIAVAFYPRKVDVGLAGGWMALWRKDPYDTRSGSADAPGNPSGVG